MRSRIASVAGLAAGLSLAVPGIADALTLGTTTPPSGSSGFTACPSSVVVAQATSDPSTPYMVPAGGGVITQWAMNATGAAGASVTLVVLKPAGGSNWTVVGADTKTIPNPVPAGGVASFSLAHPIAVSGGETLGLDIGSGVLCYWSGGATPAADSLMALTEPSAPASGQTLSPSGANSPAGFTLNVSATLTTQQDSGVSTITAPGGPTVGSFAVLGSTVTNGGPGTAPITYTDVVPSGLQVNFAASGSGRCNTSGQTVTCTITGLGAGQSAPVNVVVTPRSTGSYTNTVSVANAAGISDPNTANNTASTRFTVGAQLTPPKCVVPKLKGLPASFGRQVLPMLGCRVGKLGRAHSNRVAKGDLIKTTPGAGTYAAGRVISLQVSSGPKHKRH
jgi:Domain of unknown function DUF11